MMWMIYVAVFVISSVILHKTGEKKRKIKNNIIMVKAKILSKAERGDEFANLFDVYRLYDEACLIPKYNFWGVHHIDIGEDLDEFWKKYHEDEQNLKKNPRYKIYKLFLNNIGSALDGCVQDTFEGVHLIIKKHTPIEFDDLRSYSAGVYYANFGGGGGGGGSFGKYVPCDMNKIGQLKHSGFEKMRKMWPNIAESYDQVDFIIKQDEIDDFYNMCQLVSGEDLIC